MSYADKQSALDANTARVHREWVASLTPEERADLAAQGLDKPDTSRRVSTRQSDPITLDLAASSEPTPREVVHSSEPTEEAAADRRVAHSTRPATSSIVSYTDDSAEPSSAFLPPSSVSETSSTAADAFASFVARARSHPNPLLLFDAICFASGLMEVEGLSETALAKRHGVTRAAFSKLVVQWSQTFALTPSRGMRSKRARQSYRKSRLNHLSKLKSTAHHVH